MRPNGSPSGRDCRSAPSRCTKGFCDCILLLGWVTSVCGRSHRRWSAGGGRGCWTGESVASTVSKAYRLLRAVLNTAADDELIRRNPCRIKGAGVEHPEERPVLTLAEVMVLAEAVDPRYRMLVLLAVFGSLRWGELVGLRKSDFDLPEGLVHIERAISLVNGRQLIKKPKTAAGVRTVALPMWLVPELEQHFARYSEVEPDGRVLRRPDWSHARTVDVHEAVGEGAFEGGIDRNPRARSASHRQSLGGHLGCLDAGIDGPDGARERQRCAGLPASDGEPGSGDRGLLGCHGRGAGGRSRAH